MKTYMIAMLLFNICGAVIDFRIYRENDDWVMLIPASLFVVAAILSLLSLIA